MPRMPLPSVGVRKARRQHPLRGGVALFVAVEGFGVDALLNARYVEIVPTAKGCVDWDRVGW